MDNVLGDVRETGKRPSLPETVCRKGTVMGRDSGVGKQKTRKGNGHVVEGGDGSV